MIFYLFLLRGHQKLSGNGLFNFFPNMVITRKRIRGIFRTVERLTINYFRKKAPS